MNKKMILCTIGSFIIASLAFTVFANERFNDSLKETDKTLYQEGLRNFILSDYRSAIEYFEKVYAHNKKNEKLKKNYYKALVIQGDIEYNKKNLPEARKLYSLALSINKEDEVTIIKLKTIDDINEHVRDEIKKNEIRQSDIIKIALLAAAAVVIFFLSAIIFIVMHRKKIHSSDEIKSHALNTLELAGTDKFFVKKNYHITYVNEDDDNDNLMSSYMISARIIDAKTGRFGHSLRVAETAFQIATIIDSIDIDPVLVKKTALVHDIGFLTMKGKISREEYFETSDIDSDVYEIVKTHVTRGAKMLNEIGITGLTSECILYHHERYDGSGYPNNIHGENIPLIAMIISAAEYWDSCRQFGMNHNELSLSNMENLFGSKVGTVLYSIIMNT